ncbi:MAG: hypothetical protein DRO12_04895 [Thermoprotei archaeon]|nr:MAG: hypothetical protein DRO12_04895 [Thermoprotei archaeon]
MRVAVIGASKEGMELAKLLHDRGHEVVIIDDRRDRVEQIQSETDIAVFHGSLTSLRVYEEARVYKADIVIAAHENDDSNIIACVFAKSRQVPRVIALVNTEDVAKLLRDLHLAEVVVVRTQEITRDLLDAIMGLRSIDIERDTIVTVIDTVVHNKLLGNRINEIESRYQNIKVLAVVDENGELLEPSKVDEIKPGMKLVVIGSRNSIGDLLGIGI